MKAVLVLEDGSFFVGSGMGSPGISVGEVVFNTGMVGYTEAMTDPSYKGQILCFTYPLIGNYGVPPYLSDCYGLPLHFESGKIQVEGVVIHKLCTDPSHWGSAKTFESWLLEEGSRGIYGVDTRRLTLKLRRYGTLKGAIHVSDEPSIDKALWSLKSSKNYGDLDFAGQVSTKVPTVYRGGPLRVAVIDCGIKASILRALLSREVTIIRLPFNASAEEVLSYSPDGIFLSNGPGDPRRYFSTIETVRSLLETNKPVFGVCLGNQLLSLAMGGETYKLRYGHRGQNKPCLDLETGRCYITSQNHGYAVSSQSLPDTGLEVWFINADDKTVEGIKHKTRPLFAVQFHPEGNPGPHDTEWIFDMFLNIMRRSK